MLCWTGLLCAAAFSLSAQTGGPFDSGDLRPGPSAAVQASPPTAPALVFDADTKQYAAKPFELNAPFAFSLTNISSHDLVINSVTSSCGCTTLSLPATPWTLHPGQCGAIKARVNLAGKMGTITKTISIDTSAGLRVLSLRVVIPSPENPAAGAPDRHLAMAQAVLHPQAIFEGDCARCHVDKGRDALGERLYAADCGICHESPHRESIVPDLHALKVPTSLAFWENIIAHGKPHSLMPPFGLAEGGPLTQQQVLSLAAYLTRVIPSAPVPPTATNAAVLQHSRLASQF